LKLYRVILPVTGIEQAAALYAQVLGQPGTRVSPGRHYFDCEGTILACYDGQADGDQVAFRPNPEHVYFAVDDLHQSLARVRSAGFDLADDGIADRPWGERSFYATDPFGNPLCFVDKRTLFTG
jgi:catechol 2,3-dioxygenase-like lactoylglutathione lyase family enzyme